MTQDGTWHVPERFPTGDFGPEKPGRRLGIATGGSPHCCCPSDRVAPSRYRPEASTDPYVLALEHAVPQITGSLRICKPNARCARRPAGNAGAGGGNGPSSSSACGCGFRSAADECTAEAWSWSPGSRDVAEETTGSPKFLGNPKCPFATFSRRRQDCGHQTGTVQPRGPWYVKSRGSRGRSFGAQ
jgi:hypothetical protein